MSLLKSNISLSKKAIILPFFVCTLLFVFLTYALGLNGPYLTDYFVCLVSAYILAVVLKDNLFYVINVLFMLLVLYASNKLKIGYIGSPVQASDLLSLAAIYDIQTAAVKFVSLITIVTFFSIFLLNVKYTRLTLSVVLVLIFMFPIGYLYASSNNLCTREHAICVDDNNTQNTSAVLQFSLSIVKLLDEMFAHPSKAEIIDANKVILNKQFSLSSNFTGNIENKRDVYFVLIESMFDPRILNGQGFSRDPFNEKFRQLWRRTGKSMALSPVFGGGTANPEFELLCGIPVTSSVMRFEIPVLNSNLPCLPNLLDKNGYTTVANHPNIRGFWNRDSAYPKLGFEKYYSIDDFIKDDVLSNTYLSDKSLYRQSYMHTSKINKPVFNYVLTASEHYPYLDIENKYKAVSISTNNDYLSRYANLVHLGTQEVYEYYKKIVRDDPDAIIVILGDHLPVLGKNFAPYRDLGLFDGSDETDPEKLINMHAVPLIISDGVRGPLDVGTISIYDIPHVVSRLLFAPKGNIPLFRDNSEVGGMVYRPLPNMGILYSKRHTWGYCKLDSDSDRCRQPLSWLKAAKILDKDLTIGDMFSYTMATNTIATDSHINN